MSNKICIAKCKQYPSKNIFLLYGPLGSGKTQFVKDFLYPEPVSSPTYILYQTYQNNIYHFDLYYQHNTPIDLLCSLYIDAKYMFIEWADKIDHKFISSFKDNIIHIYCIYETRTIL